MERVRGPGPFTVLVPTDMKRLADRPIDSRSHLYQGAGRRLVIAFGQTGAPPDAFGKVNFRPWSTNIDGRPAQLATYAIAVPPNAPYKYGFETYLGPASPSGAGVNIALACTSEVACRQGLEIAHSVQFD